MQVEERKRKIKRRGGNEKMKMKMKKKKKKRGKVSGIRESGRAPLNNELRYRYSRSG